MLFCWKPETMYCILCCFLSQFLLKSYVFLFTPFNKSEPSRHVCVQGLTAELF